MKDKNILYENDEGTKTRIPFYTPCVKQRKDINRSSALYSIKAPFELLHADIADIRFFSRSAVDPKYCLFAVDLFVSKVFVCTMKNKSLLAKKLELLYQDIQLKRDEIVENSKIRLQTDLEFAQNEIKNSIKNITLKCLVVAFELERLMLLN